MTLRSKINFVGSITKTITDTGLIMMRDSKKRKRKISVFLVMIGIILTIPTSIQMNQAIDWKKNEILSTIDNGKTWVKLNPAISPSARGYFDMAYDSESSVVILMGGFHMIAADPYPINIFRDDLWVYAASTNTWTEITPDSRPRMRLTRGALAYDVKHDVVILFGGSPIKEGLCNDTWAYDYNTNTWINKTPSISPPARDAHGMVYDTQSEKIIMYGGRNTTIYQNVTERDFLHDTWIYDYETNTWENVTPSISPEGRWFFDMVYDSKADRTILFGGGTKDFNETEIGIKNDTWAFDLESMTWSQLDTINSPSPRGYLNMVYDTKANQTVLMGGSYGAGGGDSWEDILLNDTWRFDYSTKTWTDVSTNNFPGHRMRHTMVYIEEEEIILLFGGQLDNEWNTFNDETWIYTTQLYPPSEPRKLQGRYQNDTIQLTWLRPYTDGGSIITNYQIYRGKNSGNLTYLTEIGDLLSYADIDIDPDQTKYYAIRAVNAKGEGPFSEEIKVTSKQTSTSDGSISMNPGIFVLGLILVSVIHRKFAER